jgi:hypothetical protein
MELSFAAIGRLVKRQDHREFLIVATKLWKRPPLPPSIVVDADGGARNLCGDWLETGVDRLSPDHGAAHAAL